MICVKNINLEHTECQRQCEGMIVTSYLDKGRPHKRVYMAWYKYLQCYVIVPIKAHMSHLKVHFKSSFSSEVLLQPMDVNLENIITQLSMEYNDYKRAYVFPTRFKGRK